MKAAKVYADRIDAVSAQRMRLHEGERQDDSWGGAMARRFRFDRLRPLGANIEAIGSYVQPEDTVVDVGGGSGRVSLPLAFQCREVINVDPSPGMKAEFEASATEAEITNTRFIQSDWLQASEVSGDLVITSNVTYFVPDIVTFIRKMEETARRRVVITVWSVPPPNQNAPIFRLVYGEEQEASPGQAVIASAVGNGDSTRCSGTLRLISGRVSPDPGSSSAGSYPGTVAEPQPSGPGHCHHPGAFRRTL